MELLVATWTLRIALVGALAVGAISVSAGATVIDAVDRSVIAAFALTFLGRQLIGWLETPQQRMLRLRARRESALKHEKPAGGQKREKPARQPKPEKPARKQKPAKDEAPDPQAASAPDGPASTTA